MSKNFVFKKIPNDNINITRFQSFKNWTITEASISSSANVYQAIQPYRPDNFKINLNYNTDSTELLNPDSSYEKSHWLGLNETFYTDKKETVGTEHPSLTKKLLFESASILSIPQITFGERIKANSVAITDKSIMRYLNSNMTLQDDGNGNLYDTAISSASFIAQKDIIAQWGFNDQFYHPNKKILYGKLTDDTQFKIPLEYTNSTFVPGITTTGTQSLSVGYMIQLDGDGCLWNNNFEDVNFDKNDDFAISLWAKLPLSQSMVSQSVNWLLSKQGQVYQLVGDYAGIEKTYEYQDYNLSPTSVRQFPFAEQVYNQTAGTGSCGKIRVARADGAKVVSLVSTSSLNDNSFHHIVFNKSGSNLELWINGTYEMSGSDTCSENTSNRAVFTIGSNGVNNNTGLSGSLDEIYFFNRGISQAEISSLKNNHFISGSALNSTRVGNVFYRQGLIVVSDPRPKYRQVFAGNPRTTNTGSFDYSEGVDSAYYGFSTSFKSTVTTTEYEYVCNAAEGDFNLTMNPTIRMNNDSTNDELKGFVTHSAWTPYASCIGLYNNEGQLLAVGKFGSPIAIRDDVNMNFIVRFDD